MSSHHQRYVEILTILSGMPAAKFKAGEMAYLTNELYGRPRFTSDEQWREVLEGWEKFLAEMLAR